MGLASAKPTDVAATAIPAATRTHAVLNDRPYALNISRIPQSTSLRLKRSLAESQGSSTLKEESAASRISTSRPSSVSLRLLRSAAPTRPNPTIIIAQFPGSGTGGGGGGG